MNRHLNISTILFILAAALFKDQSEGLEETLLSHSSIIPDLTETLTVDSSSHHFIDHEGRIRIFHGVNFVAKHPPWYHAGLLDPKYAQDLAQWGFNVVRLGAMWSGFEPQEDFYDPVYVEKLRQIVRNFEKLGISVILDVHQDVASSHFGTYDGLPLWLVDKLRNGTERKFPWPLKSVDSWFCGYITYEASEVYQKFYNNELNSLDKFVQLWKYIAQQFKDEKSVIGYNIINEPWAGNVFKDGSLLLPSEVGRKNLGPMYELVNVAIRSVDPHTLLFWEAATWSHWGINSFNPVNKMVLKFFSKYPALTWLDGIARACGALDLNVPDSDTDFCRNLRNQSAQIGNGVARPRVSEAGCFELDGGEEAQKAVALGTNTFGSGLEQVPGGEEFKNRSVMSWHYYFPLIVEMAEGNTLEKGSTPYPWWQRQLAHNVFGPIVFGNVKKELAQLGGGRFLTEFGICIPDASRPDHWGTVECRYILKMADQSSMSWTYWDTCNLGVLWNSTGHAQTGAVEALGRPYPIAVAGRNLKFNFKPDTKIFDMEFDADASSDSPSLIYVPRHLYHGDHEIISSDDLEYTFSSEHDQILEVRSRGRVGKSWMVIGVRGQVRTNRVNSSWKDYIFSFLPTSNLVRIWKR